MKSLNLIRWGGLSVFLGALLWGVQKIGWQLVIGNQDPRAYPQPAATVLWVAGLLAALFVLLGLPALYGCQAGGAGRLGLFAFVVLFVGIALVTANAYFGAFSQAGLVDLIVIAEEAGLTIEEPVAAGVGSFISMVLYVLGWLLFGLASLRAGLLPRPAAVLVIAGLVIAFLFLATGFAPLGLPVLEIGVAWLGFALWRERDGVREPVTLASEAG